jgi:hypothetical protein
MLLVTRDTLREQPAGYRQQTQAHRMIELREGRQNKSNRVVVNMNQEDFTRDHGPDLIGKQA